MKNPSDRLKILVCLALEVLILLGVFFMLSMTSGPFDFPVVLVFSLIAPALLILTRVMMLGKYAGTESERKTDIDALCEHLRQIGLDATVESKQPSRFRTKMFAAIMIYGLIFMILFFGFLFASFLPEFNWAVVIRDPVSLVPILGLLFGLFFTLPILWLVFFPPQPSSPDSYLNSLNSPFMGSVRVANRNIDLVELEEVSGSVLNWPGSPGESIFDYVQGYRCNYVVQARVDGLEDCLRAKAKPVTVKKGFLSRELIDITWEGWELAKVLRSDADLRDTLYHMKDRVFFFMQIEPDRKHQRVRIRPKRGGYAIQEHAFPTIEAFEAFDRIAQHIRSIANIPQQEAT